MSDKTPPPQVWPTLHARDARALIDFYVRGLGFTETVTYSDDAGRVVHAELAWPHGGGIMLGSARDTSQGDAWPLRLGSFGAYAVVADPAEIDALYERAIAAGATSLRAPHDTDYGSHDCAVLDPEGNHWSFGTSPGAPRP